MADTPEDLAPIGFKLRFTWTTCPNAAAELRHLYAPSREARQNIVELRQLDLQLTFTAPRMAREDVEDKLRAIDHPSADFVFDISLLRRRKLVVHQHQVGLRRSDGARDFLELAFADE